MWQLKRTSPFAGGWANELTDEPFGLTPREYLDIWVGGASPDEWIALADPFLALMRDRGRIEWARGVVARVPSMVFQAVAVRTEVEDHVD